MRRAIFGFKLRFVLKQLLYNALPYQMNQLSLLLADLLVAVVLNQPNHMHDDRCQHLLIGDVLIWPDLLEDEFVAGEVLNVLLIVATECGCHTNADYFYNVVSILPFG